MASSSYSSLTSFTFSNPIKLDRNNYVIWKSQVLSSIRGNGLEDLINSDAVTPEEETELAVWKRQDQLLMSWLMSSMCSEILTLVVSSKNTLELWINLEKQFGSASEAKKVQLKSQLTNLKKGSMTMSEFFVKLKNISDSLAVAGYVVSNADLISYLINSLDQDYDPVVVLISSNLEKLSVDEAYAMLVSHEARLENHHVTGVKETKLNFNAKVAHSGFVESNHGSHIGRGNSNNYRGNFNNSRGYYQNFSNQGRGGNWQNQGFSNQRNFGGNNNGYWSPGRGNWQTGSNWNNSGSNWNNGKGNFNNFTRGVPSQFRGGTGHFRGGFHNTKSDVVCQICFKRFHTAAECKNRFNREFLHSQSAFQSSENGLACVATPEGVADQGWYLDSGATHHLTNDITNLNFEEFAEDTKSGQSADKGNSESGADSSSLKVLSYNVWFREDLEMHQRMETIGDLIQLHSPDIICFQEVTPDIHHIFRKSSWWRRYQCSVSNEMADSRGYFCMQLSKLPVKSFTREPFRNSIMGRELCVAEVEVQGEKPLVVATSHLESPCPGPPKWDQMFSKERVQQAKEAINLLKKNPNVIFCGDMNWDDKLDGQFPFPDGWVDAWTELRPGENGWTYDTKTNKMLSGNRALQKRLDRFMCSLRDFKISKIDMIGLEAIPGLTYVKEKKVRTELKKLELPVLPSDHYGLLLTICSQ